jgi:hypothetical protein
MGVLCGQAAGRPHTTVSKHRSRARKAPWQPQRAGATRWWQPKPQGEPVLALSLAWVNDRGLIPASSKGGSVVDLSPDERLQARDRLCYFRPASEIPGSGRFYSADPRFPCSIAVPGSPRFVYHRWDEQFLGVTFDIKGEETVAVFRTDFKERAEYDSMARDVVQGRADEVTYAELFERNSYAAGVSSKARIRRRSGKIAGLIAHRVDYANGWQRIFFLAPNYVLWNIHNRGVDDRVYAQISASFTFLSRSYFIELARLI